MTTAHRTAGTTIRVLSCLALLAAAGCQATDPYERTGVWRPNGSNDANLTAMVASPGDLVSGVGDGTSNGHLAVAAIDRLLSDKVKPLPDTGLAQITLAPSGATPASGP